MLRLRDLRSALLSAALAALFGGDGASSFGAEPSGDTRAGSGWTRYAEVVDVLPSFRLVRPSTSGSPRAPGAPYPPVVEPAGVWGRSDRGAAVVAPFAVRRLSPLAVGHPANAPPERA